MDASSRINPLLIKPLGNLLFSSNIEKNCRDPGFGPYLSRLPDQILLQNIFSDDEILGAEDLVKAQGASKAFFGFCRVEGVWKGLYLKRSKSRLLTFHNSSWRSSYLLNFLAPKSYLQSFDSHSSKSISLPTDSITTPDLYSDVLFQPYLCAGIDLESLFWDLEKDERARRGGGSLEYGETGTEVELEMEEDNETDNTNGYGNNPTTITTNLVSRVDSSVLLSPSSPFSKNSLTHLPPSKPLLITNAMAMPSTSTPLPSTPILQHSNNKLSEPWPALSSWSLSSLSKRFPDELLRAEAAICTFEEYKKYAEGSEDGNIVKGAKNETVNGENRQANEWRSGYQEEESPIYLFESDFVEKMGSFGICRLENGERKGIDEDWCVPEVFRGEEMDLFEVLEREKGQEEMKDEDGGGRPDWRWLIIGPRLSGSTLHKDPNSTSAWNALISGRKAWIFFDPEGMDDEGGAPPGVRVSEDGAEVEGPLSGAEWLINYYRRSRRLYGPKAKDPKKRNKMMECICEKGETVYVPKGWWHFVINLTPTIAITQNFVSVNELPKVLWFMKYRKDQVSGFRNKKKEQRDRNLVDLNQERQKEDGEEEDERGQGVYELFVRKLQEKKPEVLRKGFEGLRAIEEQEKHIRTGQKDANDKAIRWPKRKRNLWDELIGHSGLKGREGERKGEGNFEMSSGEGVKKKQKVDRSLGNNGEREMVGCNEHEINGLDGFGGSRAVPFTFGFEIDVEGDDDKGL